MCINVHTWQNIWRTVTPVPQLTEQGPHGILTYAYVMQTGCVQACCEAGLLIGTRKRPDSSTHIASFSLTLPGWPAQKTCQNMIPNLRICTDANAHIDAHVYVRIYTQQ